MHNKDFFIDIHTHPTLRAYNTPILQGQRNHWEKTYNQMEDTPISRWARLKTKDTAKVSQANLYAYAEGNTRVIFDSLYPVEKGFLNFRKMPVMVMGQEKIDQVLRTATGIDHHQLKLLRNRRDYFQELLSQYAFLHKGQGISPDGKHAYKLVRNYTELEEVLKADDHTIAVVVTVEGAHAFDCGLPRVKGEKLLSKKALSEHISIVKSWDYPPFFVNLAHHFYNDLCGQTRSFKAIISAAYNQKKGLNKGITELGWHAIHEMLATDNGPRILLDIKHMSVRARREYYRFLETYNRLHPSNPIPVICSHTGINDFETMKDTLAKKDKPGKMKKSDFHNWRINLSYEEIRIIHKSGGLIGIMLDKGLLASANLLDQIKKMDSPEAVKEAFVRMIARNIFGIIKAVGDRSAWDIIALGTDYDGVISHVDPYHDATQLPNLRKDLVAFIKKYQYEKELWFGLEPEEMIQKMMQHNTMDFMRRHFNTPVKSNLTTSSTFPS